MDWRTYHAINVFVLHHAWLGRTFDALETWSVPVMAIATVALWLLDRPGGGRKWKLASACALGSAAIGLLRRSRSRRPSSSSTASPRRSSSPQPF